MLRSWSKEFKVRLISALILIPVVLDVLWLDITGLYVVLWGLILAGLTYEWNNITSRPEHLGLPNLPLWFSGLWCVLMNMLGLHLLSLLLPALTSAAWLWAGRGWQSWGALYLGIPSAAFLWLAMTHGSVALLWLLLLIWATDIGGYAVGKTLKGPKLCPAISPGKTFSGLYGCMGFSAATAAIFASIQDASIITALVLGAALALLAQLGDLFESYLKRRAGKKDSGSIIPGHGGLWDRLDGLLVAAPVLTILLQLQPQLSGLLGW